MNRARREGWEAEFFAAIEAAAAGRFKYGEQDCALWAAALVKICTGRDPAIKYRGHYASAHGAKRLINEAGSLRDLVSREIGSQPIPVSQAKRGDPVLLDRDGQQFVGVIEGGSGVFLGKKGLRRINLSDCACAWETSCQR